MPEWLDLKVSLGNILTMGCLLITGIVGYTRMDGRLTSSETALGKAEMIYVRKDVSDLREAALNSRFDDLKAQLSRVEQKLDEYKTKSK